MEPRFSATDYVNFSTRHGKSKIIDFRTNAAYIHVHYFKAFMLPYFIDRIS